MKISEIAGSFKKELITHRSRLISLKCKDMRHISLSLPVEIIDYLNELKRTQVDFCKTQFCIERFIDGFEFNSLLTKPSKNRRIHLHFPEEILTFLDDCGYFKGRLIRNAIVLGFEKYRTGNLKKYQDNIETSQKQKSIKKTYTVEMTIAKVLDFLEWVWDSESEGHYRPIIAPCLETINYKTTLTLLNNILKETLKRPVVITKLKITSN
jgi:hypothetical protein